MSPRNELIRSIRRAITELKRRRMNPDTPPDERAQLIAQLAELEMQLAELTSLRIADAASGTALAPPDDETFAAMKSAARDLDDAVAQKKRTSALMALVSGGFTALQAS